MKNQKIKSLTLPTVLGVLLIIVGVLAMFSPVATFVSLSILFSISFLFAGGAETAFAFMNREYDKWWLHLLFGILNIALGIYLIMNPTLSMITLALYVGFIVMLRAVQAIMFSFELKNSNTEGWGWLLASGIVGAFFATFLIINPFFAALSSSIYVATSLIIVGALTLFFVGQLKKVAKEIDGNIGDVLEKNPELLD